MEEFLKLLNELYSKSEEEEPVVEEDGEKFFNHNENGDLLSFKAELVACGYLITEDGQCNWENIRFLRNNGYRVYAGDKDSFGWLTGCIQKEGDDRILVYG